MIFPILLIAYEFMINLSNDMFLPALPDIVKDLSTTENTTQLTISAWLAGAALTQFILGPLSDRFGRRVVLFGGGILFLAASYGCSVANSIEALIFIRFLQGTAVCSLMVSGYATIHELYDDEKSIQILSLMGSIAVIAPMMGPFIGGFLLNWIDWRTVFSLVMAIAAIPLIGLFFIMPETNTDPDVNALKPAHLFKTYKKIFKNSTFIQFAFCAGLLFGGAMVWITAAPFLLIEIHHATPFEFGLYQIPVFSGYILGSLSVKRVMKKIPVDQLIIFGLSVSLISGICFLALGTLFPESILALLAPMGTYFLGSGLASAPLNRKIFSSSTEKSGTKTAVFCFCYIGTGSFASMLVSRFYSDQLLPVACLLIGVILCSWILFQTRNLKTVKN